MGTFLADSQIVRILLGLTLSKKIALMGHLDQLTYTNKKEKNNNYC